MNAIRDRAIASSEMPAEGVVWIWPLSWLDERQMIPIPYHAFQTPLAKAVRTRLEAEDRRTVRCTAVFTDAEAGPLLQALAANAPSVEDVYAYHRAGLVRALGEERAERRLQKEPFDPQFIAEWHAAYYWLLDILGQIERDAVGLLILRDTRPRRRQWLPQRRIPYPPTPRILAAR